MNGKIVKTFLDPTVWAPVCLSVLAIVVGLGCYRNFFREFRCACVYPLEEKAVYREKLLSCTNLEQYIDWEHSSNVTSAPSDVDGWEVFAPVDSNLPARLCVVVVRNRTEAIWYPRLSGKDSSIDLLNEDSGSLRLMDHVTGREGWTSIGAQRILNLDCLSYGYLVDKDVPERLVFQLSGSGVQVWSSKGSVLF